MGIAPPPPAFRALSTGVRHILQVKSTVRSISHGKYFIFANDAIARNAQFACYAGR